MQPDNSFSISKEQLLSVLKGLLIAEAGAALVVASQWVALGTFNWHTLLALEGAALGSTAVNFLRKFIPNSQ